MIEQMNSVKPPWYGDVAIDSPALKTPMMKQFIELKTKVPDALLLFRMGDFYELFLHLSTILLIYLFQIYPYLHIFYPTANNFQNNNILYIHQ